VRKHPVEGVLQGPDGGMQTLIGDGRAPPGEGEERDPVPVLRQAGRGGQDLSGLRCFGVKGRPVRHVLGALRLP
jgi:hypothetical protein